MTTEIDNVPNRTITFKLNAPGINKLPPDI